MSASRQYEAIGSFDSLENANTFVNETIRQNRAEIESRLNAGYGKFPVETRFGYQTGREVFSDNNDSDPYIRRTYSVRVVVTRDNVTGIGIRVLTALPVNARSGDRR